MEALIDSLFNERLELESDAKKEMTLAMINLGEKILEACTDDEIRYTTVQTLCIIYPEMGETDKALALAKKMPGHYCDRDSRTEPAPTLVKKYFSCVKSGLRSWIYY